MIRKISSIGFTFFALAYVVSHFLSLVFQNDILHHFLSLSGLLALFFAILLLKGKAVILPFFLMAFAIIISLVDAKTSFYTVFWEGSTAMRALISMLLVIPIVGWVLKQENYVEDTIILLKKRLKNSKMLYFVLMLLTQLISFFLLFGSIAVVYQIVQTFFSKQDSDAWKKFKSTAVLRGFALTTLWVISIPSFVFAVEAMEAPLIPTFVQGFIFSIVGILLSVFYLYIEEKRNHLSLSTDIGEAISVALKTFKKSERLNRNPIEFLFLFVSLLALTLTVNALVPLGLLTIVPIVVVCWALAYFLIKRRFRSLKKEAKAYFSSGVVSKAPECSLLLSVGLLIAALNTSGLSVAVMEGIYDWTDRIPGLNFLWVLPLFIMFIGLVGLGPLTVMVLIAGIVQSIHLPYPPEIIVLTLTLGSSMSIMTSPLIIPSLLLSSLNGLNSIENSIKQNWKFAFGLYFLVEAYIQLVIFYF